MGSDVGIAILAGGEGRRLGGVAKGKIIFRGKPLLDHILDKTRLLGCKTGLIAKNPVDYSEWNLPVFTDIIPGKAPILGIYTALCSLNTEYVLVLAIDIPCITVDFLSYMISCKSACEIVIPNWLGNWESLCCLYSRQLIPTIREMINNKNYKPVNLLNETTPYCAITLNETSRFGNSAQLFKNINFPNDLQ